ncbi:hypothetical protein ACHAW5_007763 [Stephanodiscus triporus]|uniref:Phosphoglycerate mutase n=1 Tax=Stephanodiscus triporus TaxID=2934178 RepID=A0ABD3MQ71_9STRA
MSSSSSSSSAAAAAPTASRRRPPRARPNGIANADARGRRWHSSSSSDDRPPPSPPSPPRGLSARLNSYVERLRDERFHAQSASFSWGPDDLGLFEPRVSDVDTPPVTECANEAQIYESRGLGVASSSSSRGGNPADDDSADSVVVARDVGFHVRDGPVPRPRGDDCDYDDDGRARKRRGRDGSYGSLMDPFYVPPSRGQTHLIQGGTPCDIPNPETSRPYRLADYGEGSVYTLVLLRHGESEWNATNRYTGWCDVNLTRRGEGEARAAGRLLAANGIEVDHAFTSVLKRASYTTNMCLNMAGQHWVPVTKTWRLNERHYGALQGYNKDTAWEELGIDQELVMEMRRSYATPPPRMDDDHPYWHGRDRRYGKLTPEQLERSRSESLKDAAERIMPFFNSVIVPSLREGNRCLVVSHANTIRTLIKQIDNISDQDIKQLSIPTGIPLIYRLDRDMRPVDPNCELEFRYLVRPKGYTWATSRQHGFHGVYLGDLERLQDIQKKRDATNRGWQRVILRNIAKQSIEEEILEDCTKYHNPRFHRENVVETKRLWWNIAQKMQNPEVRENIRFFSIIVCSYS